MEASTNTLRSRVAAVADDGSDTACLDGVALSARALPSAADPSSADAVLFVKRDRNLIRANGAAWQTLVRAGTSHQPDEVSGRCKCIIPPGILIDHILGRHATSAFRARALHHSVALRIRTLGERGGIIVGAHELIGTIGAIFNPIASLRVWDDLRVGAYEAVLKARTGDVVATSCCGCWCGEDCEQSGNSNNGGGAHFCRSNGWAFDYGIMYWRTEKK